MDNIKESSEHITLCTAFPTRAYEKSLTHVHDKTLTYNPLNNCEIICFFGCSTWNEIYHSMIFLIKKYTNLT